MCVKADDFFLPKNRLLCACLFYFWEGKRVSLIKIENLTFAYGGGQNLFKNVSLSLDTNWRTGLIGRNGRGKTTLLKLMCGLYPYEGDIFADVIFAYFPYALPKTDADAPFAQLIASVFPNAELWRLERELGLMGEASGLLYAPYGTLSGGQQTKLMLAALFACETGFPLIDEPTDHLDAAGRMSVAAYLKAKRGFIVVSHDRAFLNACTDHIVSINRSDIACIRGNYDIWEENKAYADRFEADENARVKKDIGRLQQAAKRRRSGPTGSKRRNAAQKFPGSGRTAATSAINPQK
jgi:lincosamide and streptogramin A transport system ATP-binding/permease protein